MNEFAIQIEKVSKRYRIRTGTAAYSTLRETVTELAKAPFRRLKKEAQSGPVADFWALDDINLTIYPGEIVGVIGSNGAGKSTLLKILSQITKPTTGRVVLNGRIGSLLEVGTGFHPELTGRENVYLNGAILGMSKREIEAKFDQIVEFAEIGQFLDTPVKRYSSGMYVRLAFAVAAHLEPEILLVDEVLAVGDAAFQRKCLGKMGQVGSQGRTVLLVSHNMSMIQNLCGRAILLHRGRVVFSGATREVIDRYIDQIGQASKTPLHERQDRTGSGEIICTAIEVLDDSGNPTPFVLSGRQATFRVHYKSQSAKLFRNSRMSLSVHKDEQVYFLLSTELVEDRPLDLCEGYLDFVVPDLPLSVGQYYFNTFIETNKVIQDWVTGAAQLSVIDGDFYGTGRNYPPGWEGRCVLVKHTWRQSDQHVMVALK